jgi:hypothetical protein
MLPEANAARISLENGLERQEQARAWHPRFLSRIIGKGLMVYLE